MTLTIGAKYSRLASSFTKEALLAYSSKLRGNCLPSQDKVPFDVAMVVEKSEENEQQWHDRQPREHAQTGGQTSEPTDDREGRPPITLITREAVEENERRCQAEKNSGQASEQSRQSNQIKETPAEVKVGGYAAFDQSWASSSDSQGWWNQSSWSSWQGDRNPADASSVPWRAKSSSDGGWAARKSTPYNDQTSSQQWQNVDSWRPWRPSLQGNVRQVSQSDLTKHAGIGRRTSVAEETAAAAPTSANAAPAAAAPAATTMWTVDTKRNRGNKQPSDASQSSRDRVTTHVEAPEPKQRRKHHKEDGEVVDCKNDKNVGKVRTRSTAAQARREEKRHPGKLVVEIDGQIETTKWR